VKIEDTSDSPDNWPFPFRCVLDEGTEGWGSTAKAAEWAAKRNAPERLLFELLRDCV